METAKVDIRKLQLLNDRVNQCIDALNQVRLSVHGLSHTPAATQAFQPGINPVAQNPAFGLGFNAFPPYTPGISHTTGILGAAPGFYGSSVLPTLAPGFVPTTLSPLLGLSHTTPEVFETYARPVWADPVLAARISQTFPYAGSPVPAVVPIY